MRNFFDYDPINSVKDFTVNAAGAAERKVVTFAKGVYQHAESIAITTLAAFGLDALLSEIPFSFTLPLWLEAELVIPVIAVIIVILLINSSDWRAKRRHAATA